MNKPNRVRRLPGLAALAVCLPLLACASPTADKPTSGGTWVSLFDGKTLEGWRTLNEEPIRRWSVRDGSMHFSAAAEADGGLGGQDIYTVEEYGDFILELEWKISTDGNSGVKYRMDWYDDNYFGPEFQILDESDPAKAKKRDAFNVTGALYVLSPADMSRRKLKPVGEWNHIRIVANGSRIEHWLNGERVVEADTSSPEFAAAVANSKFKRWPHYGQNAKGRIMLQDHGGDVSFRNLRIQRLD